MKIRLISEACMASGSSNRMAMRHAFMLCLLLSGCEPKHDLAMTIGEQFQASGRTTIDLSTAVSGEWERVCVAGPYSDDAAIAKMLGFSWQIEGRSSIDSNDGVSLLLFIRNNDVVLWVEMPRRSGDFSNLSGRCFDRSKAQFRQEDHPSKGWPGLFPGKEG